MKGGLQVHFLKVVGLATLLDVAGQKRPFHEFNLVACRLAIRRDVTGMRQAERRQRDLLLMT
jgi:hypothetical protein